MNRLASFPPEWEIPPYREEIYAPKRTRYCLVVPFLDEGERIRRELQRLEAYSCQIDVLLVDGGSTDGAIADGIAERVGVRAVCFRQYGRGLSGQMRIGLAVAMREGYEGVVLIDGNDKDNPDAIPRFVAALDEGFDHIQGSRFVKGGRAIHTPRSRLLGVRLLHAPLISLAAGHRYTDTTNGFRAYSRRLLLDPRVQPFRDVFARYELHYYLAVRAGRLRMRIAEVPVERAYPADGSVPSKISSVRGNILILKTLAAAVAKRWDPDDAR